MINFRNDIRDLPAYKEAMDLFNENKPYETIKIKGGTLRYQNLRSFEIIGRIQYPPIEDPEGLVPDYLKWMSLEEQPIHAFATINGIIEDVSYTIDEWLMQVNSHLEMDEMVHVRFTYDFVYRKHAVYEYSKCTSFSDIDTAAKHLSYLALQELASNDEIDIENFEVT